MNNASNQPEFWIIDDDFLYLRELVRALSTELSGYKIVKFMNAQPVLKALEKGLVPAGALVDMVLAHDEWDNPIDWPEGDNRAKNGIAIVAALRRAGLPASQVGVATAVIEENDLKPLDDFGFDRKNNLLINPAETEEFRRLVRRILTASRNPGTPS